MCRLSSSEGHLIPFESGFSFLTEKYEVLISETADPLTSNLLDHKESKLIFSVGRNSSQHRQTHTMRSYTFFFVWHNYTNLGGVAEKIYLLNFAVKYPLSTRSSKCCILTGWHSQMLTDLSIVEREGKKNLRTLSNWDYRKTKPWYRKDKKSTNISQPSTVEDLTWERSQTGLSFRWGRELATPREGHPGALPTASGSFCLVSRASLISLHSSLECWGEHWRECY